jgi:RNA polymerase sigma-70 factor, ECF subfamily
LISSIAQPIDRLMLETSPSSDPQIARLTCLLKSGDESAFRQFHEQYFDRLYRYALVCVHGNEDAARDAVQETLLRVVRHVRRFDDADAFWNWLTVLARSAVTDGGRRRTRYSRLLKRYALGAADPAPPQNGELFEALELSLAELPPDDQSLLRRKYEDGASVKEIALESGATEDAVESRLVRIRRRLRSLVFKQLSNERAR